MTIVEFLRARYGEDQAIAQAAADQDDSGWWWTTPESDVERHVAHHNPARVLREVEAKRLRLEVIEADLRDDETDETARYLAQVDAAVYSDHPDFDPSWRV